MNPNRWLDSIDARMHAKFERAGLACTGIYTPPEGGAPRTQRAVVDPAGQSLGEHGQIRSPRTTICFLLADGPIEKNGTFAVGDQVYRLQRIDEADEKDGSLERWAVTHG